MMSSSTMIKACSRSCNSPAGPRTHPQGEAFLPPVQNTHPKVPRNSADTATPLAERGRTPQQTRSGGGPPPRPAGRRPREPARHPQEAPTKTGQPSPRKGPPTHPRPGAGHPQPRHRRDRRTRRGPPNQRDHQGRLRRPSTDPAQTKQTPKTKSPSTPHSSSNKT